MTLTTVRARHGIVTAPHHLAAQAGLDVLRDGGTAAEAGVAIAACLAVVYPHMTGLGGDGFWLLGGPDGSVRGVDGCGRAAHGVSLATYQGRDAIPWRGPLAANTVAGTVSSWDAALAIGGGSLPLSRLLRDAIGHAEQGVAITESGARTIAAKAPELMSVAGWADVFLSTGRPPVTGDMLRQPMLARTLRRLADAGPEDFYRGDLARQLSDDLARAGSPISAADLADHRAEEVTPLSVRAAGARLYNMPPPTQGLASLLILALFDRLPIAGGESFGHVHGLVEATKQAFLIRDTHVHDPARVTLDCQGLLDNEAALTELAARIDPESALPWPQPASAGDTCWFGAIDSQGRVASAIQSTYFEFGSGVVSPSTGVTWQNRGASFRLAEHGWNALRPGAKPFHTLNPALARFDNGRLMAYGTMGGEGQPQTQAALFTRYACFGMDLQDAITAPRWLLGRTWGEESVTLKLEDRFDPALVERLRHAGHDVEMMPPFSEAMGHAGALVRHADGLLEGASDPRSDGQALGW